MMELLKRLLQRRATYRSFWHEMADFARIVVLTISLAIFVCGFLVPLSTRAYQLLGAQLFFTFSILYRGIPRSVRITMSIVCISAMVLLFYLQVTNLPTNDRAVITTMPTTRSFAGLNSLVKEEDGVYLGLRFLSLISGITNAEYSGLQDHMEREYTAMRAAYSDFPTPLIATFLGAESPLSFDLLSFSSEQNREIKPNGKKALIFLHGFGGNWSLICWILSEGVNPLGIQTFCPSTGPLGTWGSTAGSQILASLMSKLEHDGFTQIYLSGISAGAVGAVTLAKQYQNKLSGLILISGLGPGIADLPIKTLLITGKGDERFTPEIVKWVIKNEKTQSSLLEHHWLEGDHLLVVKKKAEMQELIRKWLNTLNAGQTSNDLE